jgi:hypothetical protein
MKENSALSCIPWVDEGDIFSFDPSAVLTFVIEGMLAVVSVVGGVVCSYPGPFFVGI